MGGQRHNHHSLIDLDVCCKKFRELAKQYGFDLNKYKTWTQTSTHGKLVFSALRKIDPILAKSVKDTISEFSVEKNPSDCRQNIGKEVVNEYRLLEYHVESDKDAEYFILKASTATREDAKSLEATFPDEQTGTIFKQWTIPQLPHLLGYNLMYGLDDDCFEDGDTNWWD